MLASVATQDKCYKAAFLVLKKARKETGLRRGQFRRAYKKRDSAVMAAIAVHANEEAVGIDPDRLREILEIILEFIKMFMMMF